MFQKLVNIFFEMRVLSVIVLSMLYYDTCALDIEEYSGVIKNNYFVKLTLFSGLQQYQMYANYDQMLEGRYVVNDKILSSGNFEKKEDVLILHDELGFSLQFELNGNSLYPSKVFPFMAEIVLNREEHATGCRSSFKFLHSNDGKIEKKYFFSPSVYVNSESACLLVDENGTYIFSVGGLFLSAGKWQTNNGVLLLRDDNLRFVFEIDIYDKFLYARKMMSYTDKFYEKTPNAKSEDMWPPCIVYDDFRDVLNDEIGEM